MWIKLLFVNPVFYVNVLLLASGEKGQL